MDAKTERMKELVELLNQASKAYYQQDTEIMSNLEYDALYDELAALEQETGLILSKSPTQNVGYEIISELPKERHPAPMLSLDKTKSVEDLAAWLGDKTGVMSWKMDGLTVVLTYEDGVLVKAVTRGNGEIGEVITNNAKVFANLRTRLRTKVRLRSVARRSLPIQILSVSMPRFRILTANIKTRETYAPAVCGSSIIRSQPSGMCISLRLICLIPEMRKSMQR